MIELYPGQAYIHRHSPNVKRAEENWMAKQGKREQFQVDDFSLHNAVTLCAMGYINPESVIGKRICALAEAKRPNRFQITIEQVGKKS